MNSPSKIPVLRIQKFTGKIRRARQQWKRAYYFRVVAANNEIVAQSEAYTSAAARNKTVRPLASAVLIP